MESFGAYILSVAAGAMICTAATALLKNCGNSSTVLKLVCGVIMAVIVIRPLDGILLPDLQGYILDLEGSTAAAVQAGTEQRYLLLNDRITEQTQAYILDKAESLGMTLEVSVELDQGTVPVPVRITLIGKASPSAKAALQEFIAENLGIGKEDQVWISEISPAN